LTTKSKKLRIGKSVRIIAVIVVALIVFRIVLHYTEMGFFEFILFDLIPKWFFFLLPIVFLIYRISKKHTLKNSIFDFAITTIGFVIIYYFLTPYYFDKVDWKVNLDKREKIVSLAKANRLKNVRGSIYAIPDSLSLFPFFKSNEVTIQTLKDTFVTITFYTDRGLNDHYSGFIYTNDSTDVKTFDENVRNGGNDFKLKNNWYLIHD
jgi:hypothetical protein